MTWTRRMIADYQCDAITYLDNVPAESVQLLWNAGSWNRPHGDRKSSVNATVYIESMVGGDGLYKIRLKNRAGVEVYFEAAERPEASQVIEELKARINAL